MEPGAPILLIRRIRVDKDGRPLEVTEVKASAEQFETTYTMENHAQIPDEVWDAIDARLFAAAAPAELPHGRPALPNLAQPEFAGTRQTDRRRCSFSRLGRSNSLAAEPMAHQRRGIAGARSERFLSQAGLSERR